MGKTRERKKTELAQAVGEALVVQTMGGRMHVRWGETAQATVLLVSESDPLTLPHPPRPGAPPGDPSNIPFGR